MRRLTAILLAVVLLCFCSCDFGQKEVEIQEKVVNLYVAPGTIPETILRDFTAGTGIAVKCYNLSDADEALAKLGTGISPFDLIFADNLFLERAAGEGVLQEIDQSNLPNSNLFLPQTAQLLTETSSAYLLPYTRTCAVLLHNVAYTQAPVVSYANLWSQPMLGKVSVLPDARLMSAVALKSSGFSVNAASTTELTSAQKKLVELKVNEYSCNAEKPGEEIAKGLSGLSVVWAKDAQAAHASNNALEILYPSEGAIVKMNCMALSATAPHTKEAYLLMDYLLRPENSMAIAKHLGEESLNSVAAELQDADYENMIAVHMAKKYDGSAVECLHYAAPQARYDEIWKAYVQTEIEAEE